MMVPQIVELIGVQVMLNNKEMLIPIVKVRLLEQFLQVLVVMMVIMGIIGEVVALVGAVEELVPLVRVLEEMIALGVVWTPHFDGSNAFPTRMAKLDLLFYLKN